ncbi:MAG: hypothetical protein HZA16_00335 [Nitrospirae bacterium]|nr:hypothetical protein [Nitrospirota bacterium]
MKTIRERLLIFSQYFLGFLIFFWIISEIFIGSDWVFHRLDPLRPTFIGIDMPIQVQKQIYHIEKLFREPDSQARIIFVGSSSVVNGVDVGRIGNILSAESIDYRPLNYGAIGLYAYELPLLKKYLLDQRNEWVVYLYNTFSFGDTFHPQAIRIRWNTSEALRLANHSRIGAAEITHFSSGIFSEVFTLIRYSNFYEECFRRFISNRLKPTPYEWDYPAEDPPVTIKDLSVAQGPAPSEDFMRSLYLDSFLKNETIGYTGLRRFLELARQAGIKVIVAPIPEPDMAVMYPWKNGIDERVIDEKVRSIAENNGAVFIGRSETEYIEKQSSNFRDHVHANWVGRNEYSDWLAGRIAGVIGK